MTEKHITFRFFKSSSGDEPVRDWLKSLSVEDKRIIGKDLSVIELGFPIGMPLCRSLGNNTGLWEARSSLPNGRIARIIFCVKESYMVALTGFIKKTEKTSQSEINLSLKRKGEL